MMDQNTITVAGTAIYSAIMLLFLWFFTFYLWRDYRNQTFRQDLFTLRAKLFQYASEGNIQFDNPAYRALRTSMNALIRYAYHMTFTTLVLVIVFNKLKKPSSTKGVAEVICSEPNLTPVQRQQLMTFHLQVIIACAWQVGTTSVLAWPCFAFVVVWAWAKAFAANLRTTKTGLPAEVPLPSIMVRHLQDVEYQAVQSEREREACLV